MSTLHLRHIKTTVENQFNGLIDMTDYDGKPQGERDTAFLSRGLAAYALSQLAGLPPQRAAQAIVDGFDDNGIAAIHFDPADKIMYVGQSKWMASGNGSPSQADIKKFVDGFRDLINAQFDRFNNKVKAKEAEILTALDDPNARFVLFIAYTGLQPLAEHPARDVSDLEREMNDPTEMVSFQVLTQKELHNRILGQAEGDPINLDVSLKNWGPITEPYAAYYGEIDAPQIAAWWSQYDRRLFAKNLRTFIGSTDVNEALAETLHTCPENFWYFNNGITILCKTIRKKPMGGSDRAVGSFVCEGISIVNGAQTVGAIGSAHNTHPDQLAKASVAIRLISLENCPETFVSDITRATNTQNRIDKRDFASLDPQQLRLQAELFIEGKAYVIKRGEPDPAPAKGCNIVEATIALACANRDIKLAVQAKREVSKLFDDIQRSPYTTLFNAQLTTTRLWRGVEIFREVEQELKRLEGTEKGRNRMVAIHGNRFVLYRVYREVEADRFDDASVDFSKVSALARSKTKVCLDATIAAINSLYPDSYLASLFKNAAKCEEINNHIVKTAPPDVKQTELFDQDNTA